MLFLFFRSQSFNGPHSLSTSRLVELDFGRLHNKATGIFHSDNKSNLLKSKKGDFLKLQTLRIDYDVAVNMITV